VAGQDAPQQMRIDVVVDNLDVAEAAVLELGASQHEHQPGTTFRASRFFRDACARGHPLMPQMPCAAAIRNAAKRSPSPNFSQVLRGSGDLVPDSTVSAMMRGKSSATRRTVSPWTSS
jgi:hypothetical protein